MNLSSCVRATCVAALMAMTCLASQGQDIVATKARPAERSRLSQRGAGRSGVIDRQIPTLQTKNHKPAKAGTNIPPAETMLCGIKVYDDAWGEVDRNGQYVNPIDAGIYTIEVRENGKISPVKLISGMASAKAAIKHNNTMYCISASNDGESITFSQYSATTWNSIGTTQETDAVNVPTDLTYDPVTGKIYGFFYDSDYYGDYDRFCSFSLSTAEASDIKVTEREGYAIAADGKGTIYVLYGAYNYLATIDPLTGYVQRIKTTGLDPALYNCMVYDEEEDRLLAVVTTESGIGANRTYTTALWQIDPRSAEVSKIMDMPGNANYIGLYVMPRTIAPTAPDAVTDVRFSYHSSTAGSVSFTAPSTTASGAPLTGNIMVIIETGGSQIVIEDVMPGQSVTSDTFPIGEGQQSIRITAADSNHRGNPVKIEVWGGDDVPAAVTDVVLSSSDGIPTLSWKAPSAGINGGMIDMAKTRYRITRRPDNVTVAENATGTTFTDNNPIEGLKSIYYDIVAFNDKGDGPVATSNRYVFGGGYSVPFAEGFDSSDAFDLWSVENVNGGSTWTYDDSGKCPVYKYDENRLPADDWMISPPIGLKGGKTYRLSYAAKVFNKSYKESFEMALGSAPRARAMNKVISRHNDIANTSFETFTQVFTVESDGEYYLGIHATSAAYQWSLYVDNVGISLIDSRTPAAVDDLTITPGNNGQLTATIAFKAPVADAEGGVLEDISVINIYRGESALPVHTITSPDPGESLSWTDSTIGSSGIYTYRITCSNGAGDGADAKISAFIGTDVPGPVGDLTLMENSGGKPSISWTPPTTGANGGYFDISAVTYRIVRSDGEVVAQEHTSTSYTDGSYEAPSGSQDAVYYTVTPYCGTGKGTYAATDLVLFGSPYPCPFTETFPNGDMGRYPWVSHTDGSLNSPWTLDVAGYTPTATDQNGDKGLATFHSHGEQPGGKSYIYSPKIDLSALDKPVLSFWLYHSSDPDTPGEEAMDVLIVTDSRDMAPIPDSPTIKRDNGTTGWARYSLDLTPCINSNWIRIVFCGTTGGGQDIYIDNITIADGAATDLEISKMSGACRIAQGEPAIYEIEVTNIGTSDIHDARIDLSDNEGNILASAEIPSLQSGQRTVVSLRHTFNAKGSVMVTACVNADGDEVAENNSASMTTDVVEPVIPAPSDLSGEVTDGNVSLSWTAADDHGAVTDDVESYTDWAIDDIGEWTMVDRDFDVTYRINKDLASYPDQNTPKAWQVCNAKALGINIWDEGTPHSGDKMFMSMASVNYVNNDWMISPRLNGSAQTISFYAKSFTLQDTPNERMRVLYSTTDTDPENFIKIHAGEYIELPDQWTEYRYFIPEGAVYFAINGVSDNAFALFVDDLSFNDLTVPRLSEARYEVWRDDALIATVSGNSYIDSSPAPESATYKVRAVYDKATSGFSNPITIASDYMDQVLGGQPEVRTEGHNIIVSDARGYGLSVSNAAGVILFSGTVQEDMMKIPVPQGVFIVKTGETIHKIIVR